jgi:hypothetical protein
VCVHLAAKHALELEVAHVGFEALCIALDVARRRLIALRLGELQQLGRLIDAPDGAIDLADVGAQAGALAPEVLGARGIRPDVRILELAPNFLESFLFAVVFKETPVAKPCARRGL